MKRYGIWVVILPLMVLLSGCQNIAGLYALFIDPLIPPEVIAAEHDMSGQKVLVWVDDPRSGSQYVLLRRSLTQALGAELVRQQAVDKVVSYEKISRFRVRHPDYGMNIKALGEKFQVDQVVYLLVNDFSWDYEAGTGFYQPKIRGYIKVMDAQDDGRRLWPEDRVHQTFQYKGAVQEGKGALFKKKLLQTFSQTVASGLSKYFYEHTLEKP